MKSCKGARVREYYLVDQSFVSIDWKLFLTAKFWVLVYSIIHKIYKQSMWRYKFDQILLIFMFDVHTFSLTLCIFKAL